MIELERLLYDKVTGRHVKVHSTTHKWAKSIQNGVKIPQCNSCKGEILNREMLVDEAGKNYHVGCYPRISDQSEQPKPAKSKIASRFSSIITNISEGGRGNEQ